MGNGVFRTPFVGKYDQRLNASPPDSVPISSATTARQARSDIAILYQNVGGMNSFIEDYRLAVSDHCYDIIVLVETWLDSRTLSSYVFGADYEVFRCDRNPSNSRKTSGGGVLVAVSSRLKARTIENSSWNTVEQVWVAVELGDHQLLLCAIYIPPDRTRDIELLDTHCRSVDFVSGSAAPCDEIMIMGDFNLAGIAWIRTHSGFFCPDNRLSTFHAGAIKLLDSYSTAMLYQINGVTNENNRSLDLCFVGGRDTAPFIFSAPAPLVKLVPHHPPLVVMIEEYSALHFTVTPNVVAYDFRKADHRAIEDVLAHLDWDQILDSDDVNLAAQTFSHVLSYVIDRHVPKKIVRAGSRAPWMTSELRSLKTTKRAAFKRFNKFRTLPLKQHYVQLNHQYKRLSKFCYHRYQNGIQRRLRSHPKSFWNYVNEQRKECGLPSSMELDGITATTQHDICKLFAIKFASVFF